MNVQTDIINSTPASERLREKNIAFFEGKDLQLHQAIVNAPELSSALSFKGEVCENIFVGGKALYGKSCRSYTENQLADFWKKPERLIFPDTSHCNVTAVTRGLMTKMNTSFFARHPEGWKSREPVVDSGFCFVVGLGLGLYLEDLIDKKVARNIVIAEPVGEFFIQSLSILDWENLYEKAEDNGIDIKLLLNRDPMILVEGMEAYVRKVGNSFLDGSYFFVHYSSWETQKTYRLLRERLKNYYLTTGFFEDELVMMRNAFQNLYFGTFRFLKRKRYLHQDYPVFVVAAGPSLEFDLDVIKKYRDQVILVSSGTTLHVLLKEGLRPDFHAEIENVADVYNLLKPKHEEFGFDGITLLASATVDHRIAGLFEDVYYFARAAVSSSTVFCKGMGTIAEVSPYSANSALASIATLGFRNLYLFGVDCGRYEGAKHHASGSVYEEIGIDVKMEESLKFHRMVPGNFGGEVSTTVLLDMSRRHITGLINRLKLRVYNCSHGAKIDGAYPLSGTSIKLDNPAGRQQAIKKKLHLQSKQYHKGDFIKLTDLQEIVDSCDPLISELGDFLEGARQDINSFYDFDHAIEDFWDERFDRFGPLFIIMGGSLASMLRVGAYMGQRLIDEELRREFMANFYEYFEEQCVWMIHVLRNFYQEMANGHKEIDIPEEFDYEAIDAS